MNFQKTGNNLIDNFVTDCSEFSLAVAVGRFVRDIPVGDWSKRNYFYEKRIYNYIYKKYKDIFLKYAQRNDNKAEPVSEKYIWVMWWDGYENMPPIVKACYDRLKKCVTDEKLILITMDNYKEYVDLPEYIYEKVENKEITLTHFSDIIRMNLLKQYGGLWIDSTVYVEKIPEYIFSSDMYVLKDYGLFPIFISRGERSPYLVCIKHENAFFAECIESVFLKYWTEHSTIIDYLFIDYVIKIMRDNIPAVKALIDSVPTTKGFYEMNLAMNEKYDEKRFNEIMESPMQKLSYKKDCSETIDGELTMYGYMIRRK